MAEIEQLHDRGRRRGRATGNGGNGGDLRERLAGLAADMKHVATKADLKGMENRLIMWMMGVIGLTVVGLVTAALRSMS